MFACTYCVYVCTFVSVCICVYTCRFECVPMYNFCNCIFACACVFMYMYICISMFVGVCTYIECVYMYVYKFMYVHVYISVCVHTCICLRVYTCMFMFCACVFHVYVCVCVRAYLCVLCLSTHTRIVGPQRGWCTSALAPHCPGALVQRRSRVCCLLVGVWSVPLCIWGRGCNSCHVFSRHCTVGLPSKCSALFLPKAQLRSFRRVPGCPSIPPPSCE